MFKLKSKTYFFFLIKQFKKFQYTLFTANVEEISLKPLKRYTYSVLGREFWGLAGL